MNLSFLHFNSVATSVIDNVLLEHGGLPHVLPLAVHLDNFTLDGLIEHSAKNFLLFGFSFGRCWVVGAHCILVSAPIPLELIVLYIISRTWLGQDRGQGVLGLRHKRSRTTWLNN